MNPESHGRDKKTVMELGVQPLDAVITKAGWNNHDLVQASTQGLTHKMVSKGRKGRRLTLNVQTKILAAVRALSPETEIQMKDLFNYAGKQ